MLPMLSSLAVTVRWGRSVLERGETPLGLRPVTKQVVHFVGANWISVSKLTPILLDLFPAGGVELGWPGLSHR